MSEVDKEKKPFNQCECDWRYHASCTADISCADDCDMECPYMEKN